MKDIEPNKGVDQVDANYFKQKPMIKFVNLQKRWIWQSLPQGKV